MVNSISNIINKNEFICKAIKNSNFKINVSTIEGYRKLSKFLKERNIIHHTYQLKQDKAFRVLLRNIDHSINVEDDVKFELDKKGFDVRI